MDAAVSPDGKLLYVTDNSAFRSDEKAYTGGVHVVDIASRKVKATINVGEGPIDIVLNRAGTRAYVVNNRTYSVSVINTRTNEVLRTFPVSVSPSQIVLNSAETIGYLACTDGLVLLDLQTGSIVERIPAGWNTQTVAVNAAETTAYTINLTDGTLTVIALPARTIKTVIKLGQFAYGVTVNPGGTRAYVNALDSIVVVNLSTAEIITTIPVTRVVAGRVHLNKAGTLGFTVAGHDGKSPAGGILHVIKLSTNTVVGTAPVGFMADSIAFVPSGLEAYVPSGGSEGTVTLLQMPQ
jgi:YVTN family beta-propeller protein